MERAEEAARVRAERLAAELEEVTARLADAERARAGDAARLAALETEAAAARRQRSLLAWKLTAPLLAVERGVRWAGGKAAKLVGLLARQVLFRGTGRN